LEAQKGKFNFKSFPNGIESNPFLDKHLRATPQSFPGHQCLEITDKASSRGLLGMTLDTKGRRYPQQPAKEFLKR